MNPNARLHQKLGMAGAVLLLAPGAFADVTLPHFFSEHMVLQKGAKVPVWGKAEPGEAVTVTVAGIKGQTTASAEGKWRVDLDLSKAGEGPFQMVVDGKNHLEVKDVLLGEVWLCSGQSNMQFQASRDLTAATEIPNSANAKLRHFWVTRANLSDPVEDCGGSWQVAGPETTGGFSAVAYFFGKAVQNKLGTPVGLITAAVGDTPVEAWTSYAALSQVPELKNGADQLVANGKNYPAGKEAYLRGFPAWQKQYAREDKPGTDPAPFATFQDPEAWKSVTLPGNLPSSGAVWLVRRLTVPEAQAGKDLPLALGKPDGWESVYWNGTLIGARKQEKLVGDRGLANYTVPGAEVKAGKNTLAIRIFSSTGTLGIPAPFPLAGEWKAKYEFELPPLTAEAQAAMPVPPVNPPDPKKMGASLFNGMIHPLIPFAMKGAIWYQGETNAERAAQYKTAFPLMIRDWRSRWGQGDFPFYFCQLANYHAKLKVPGDNSWSELREAQASALSLPNTGQAVLIDIGEAANIHPGNKKDAGGRLAALALARTYGQNLAADGPVFESMKVEKAAIRVRFKPGPGGLAAKPLPATFTMSSAAGANEPLARNSPNSEVEGFAICGEDKVWVWADAKIEGDTIVVSSPQVTAPIAVRYAWAKNPTCNLYNGAGFPASPFRTDQFPLITENQKF